MFGGGPTAGRASLRRVARPTRAPRGPEAPRFDDDLPGVALAAGDLETGVLEEKTTRVAEVVISSIKPEVLLAGKVAGAGAVGLTQQVLWLSLIHI